MQNRIRIARGTTSQITASQQFAEVGQPFYDTDKGYLSPLLIVVTILSLLQ